MIVNDANGSLKTMTILTVSLLACIPWLKVRRSMVKLIMWLFMSAQNTPKTDFKAPSSASKSPSNTLKWSKP
jgi:hypothetical protein